MAHRLKLKFTICIMHAFFRKLFKLVVSTKGMFPLPETIVLDTYDFIEIPKPKPTHLGNAFNRNNAMGQFPLLVKCIQ